MVDGSVVDTIGLFSIDGPVDRNGMALLTPRPEPPWRRSKAR